MIGFKQNLLPNEPPLIREIFVYRVSQHRHSPAAANAMRSAICLSVSLSLSAPPWQSILDTCPGSRTSCAANPFALQLDSDSTDGVMVDWRAPRKVWERTSPESLCSLVTDYQVQSHLWLAGWLAGWSPPLPKPLNAPCKELIRKSMKSPWHGASHAHGCRPLFGHPEMYRMTAGRGWREEWLVFRDTSFRAFNFVHAVRMRTILN